MTFVADFKMRRTHNVSVDSKGPPRQDIAKSNDNQLMLNYPKMRGAQKGGGPC